MTDQFRRVETIFHAARLLPSEAQEPYVHEAANGDEEIARQVASLLAADSESLEIFPQQRQRETIGPYRVLRKLGEGGMGVVYAALDHRLRREVAIKVIGATNRDARARERLRREARMLAGVSHPNICRIYEIGDDERDPYIVMELLDGESLAARLRRGPMPFADAVRLAIDVLAALEALHKFGIVHRDLKPSNIFLSPQGLKLVDFGLARVTVTDDAALTAESVTRTGAIVGTPHYMSPEQIQGRVVDARSDLFALATVLYEALTGSLPFDARDIASVLHAVIHLPVPVLTGSAEIEQVDRILRRAHAKLAEDRYASAASMAADLRKIEVPVGGNSEVVARSMTRLAVLPFQFLRDDPEFGFLSRSLAEAIASSLSRVPSLVVRSAQMAAKFAQHPLDLHALVAGLDVDVIVAGNLLRNGEELRYQAELIEVPSGTVRWSQRAQIVVRDVFQVEDDVTRRVVEALELPLTEREHRFLRRDVPGSPRAYEFYLRGLQQGHDPENWHVARDLYRRSVDEDPQYAPAWARLGRAEFLIAKYASSSDPDFEVAERSVRKALELDSTSPTAHQVYAQIQLEMGSSQAALTRLASMVSRARLNAQLQAAIVHAARYCGLLDESLAAHRQARSLDPNIDTSVALSHFMRGDYTSALATVGQDIGYVDALILFMLGRSDEAIATLRQREGARTNRRFALWISHLRAAIEGRRDEAIALATELRAGLRDPEGRYYLLRIMARLGADDDLVAELNWIVDHGFFCVYAFENDPWLVPVRELPAFPAVLERARQRHEAARRAFVEASDHQG